MTAGWKRYAGLAIVVLSTLGAFACAQPDSTTTTTATTGTPGSAPSVKADKPFAPGGTITLQLAAGSYDVRGGRR
jgi:hypothetical protein